MKSSLAKHTKYNNETEKVKEIEDKLPQIAVVERIHPLEEGEAMGCHLDLFPRVPRALGEERQTEQHPWDIGALLAQACVGGARFSVRTWHNGIWTSERSDRGEMRVRKCNSPVGR